MLHATPLYGDAGNAKRVADVVIEHAVADKHPDSTGLAPGLESLPALIAVDFLLNVPRKTVLSKEISAPKGFVRHVLENSPCPRHPIDELRGYQQPIGGQGIDWWWGFLLGSDVVDVDQVGRRHRCQSCGEIRQDNSPVQVLGVRHEHRKDIARRGVSPRPSYHT